MKTGSAVPSEAKVIMLPVRLAQVVFYRISLLFSSSFSSRCVPHQNLTVSVTPCIRSPSYR